MQCFMGLERGEDAVLYAVKECGERVKAAVTALAPSAPLLGAPGFLLALMVATAPLLSTTAVHAEAAVGGTMDAVQIEAHGSSIAEVLAALCKALHCRYRTAVKLDQPVDGTFKGSLTNVLSRLLQNYDYVVKVSGAVRIEEIAVKARSGEPVNVIALPTPPLPHRGP